MKKSILFLLLTAFLGLTLNAQNDTMYVMKNGVIVGRYNVNTQIDSLIYYNPFPTSGIFTDSRDGNTYKWVKIGTQIWMAENLKYLPSVVGPEILSNTVPYYYVNQYYGTDVTAAKATSHYNTYGVLYNWPAAMAGSSSSSANPSGVQGVCPTGWHLPSHSEWSQLTTFLGGVSNAGRKLREVGTTHWISPNTGATDEVGFTALPGGFFTLNNFSNDYGVAFWWSSLKIGTISISTHTNTNQNDLFWGYEQLSVAFNIRCVKN